MASKVNGVFSKNLCFSSHAWNQLASKRIHGNWPWKEEIISILSNFSYKQHPQRLKISERWSTLVSISMWDQLRRCILGKSKLSFQVSTCWSISHYCSHSNAVTQTAMPYSIWLSQCKHGQICTCEFSIIVEKNTSKRAEGKGLALEWRQHYDSKQKEPF